MTPAAIQIQSAIMSRIETLAAFVTTRLVPVPPLQPQQMPALAVYYIGDDMDPRGDPNTGTPRYATDASFGVELFLAANDPVVAQGNVAALVDLIKTTLLSDPSFISLRDVDNVAIVIIESIGRINTAITYPTIGDTYYCDARVRLSIRFNEDFPPTFPNELESITVAVAPFGIGTNADKASLTVNFGTNGTNG